MKKLRRGKFMIAEDLVKVSYENQSDVLYVNYERPLSYPNDEVDTQELGPGIYRVYNESIPSVTYRYVILDYSYQNKTKLESLIGIALP